MRTSAAGRVQVAGRRLRGGDPREAILAGVAHVPEDRLGTGLAPSLSVTSNVVIKTYRRSLAVARAAPPPATHARRGRRDHPRYDVKTPGRDACAQPLRREPPEARPGARVRGRPARPRRRPADTRARRRRDRDGALVPPRRGGEGRRDPADERGPRRDPRARRPHPRHLRGRDRRRASCGSASVEEIGLLMAGGTRE